MHTLRLLLLAGIAALAGCALSPQTVVIDPLLPTAATTVATGQPLDVRVVDARGSDDLGTRGGVYSESSRILPGNDIADAVRSRAVEGLTARGYSIGQSVAAAQVRLAVERLSYDVPAGTLAASADISAVIKATAERGGEKLETTYRSTVNRKFPVPPTATQNAAWINEVLGDTLARFLDDAKMHAFLQGR